MTNLPKKKKNDLAITPLLDIETSDKPETKHTTQKIHQAITPEPDYQDEELDLDIDIDIEEDPILLEEKKAKSTKKKLKKAEKQKETTEPEISVYKQKKKTKSDSKLYAKLVIHPKTIFASLAVIVIGLSVLYHGNNTEDLLQGQLQNMASQENYQNSEDLQKHLALKQEEGSVWPPKASTFFSLELGEVVGKFSTSQNLGEFVSLTADFSFSNQENFLSDQSKATNTNIDTWCYQVHDQTEQCYNQKPSRMDILQLPVKAGKNTITLTVFDKYGRSDKTEQQITLPDTLDFDSPKKPQSLHAHRPNFDLDSITKVNILASQDSNTDKNVILADSHSTIYFNANCQSDTEALLIELYPNMSDFQNSQNKQIYSLDIASNEQQCNQPQKTTPRPRNSNKPKSKAICSISHQEAEVGQTIQMIGDQSLGETLKGTWNFGDQNTYQFDTSNHLSVNTSHIYQQSGTYEISLEIESTTKTSSCSQLIYISDPKTPHCTPNNTDQSEPSSCDTVFETTDKQLAIDIAPADYIYESARNLQGQKATNHPSCLSKINRNIQFADFKNDQQDNLYNGALKDLVRDIATTAYKNDNGEVQFLLNGKVRDGYRYFLGKEPISSQEIYKLLDVSIARCLSPHKKLKPFPTPEISEDHWVLSHIYNLANHQIIYKQNLEIDTNISRAQFLEILSRFNKLPLSTCEAGEQITLDVNSQHPQCDAIKTAITHRIITPDQSEQLTHFYPNNPLTRSNALILIHNYLAAVNAL